MQEASKYPLSIITINLNNREGLEKTMESVVNQTFRDFEYIVIDGASTDGSVGVIQRYADNIHYWVSEPDTGIYNAMNKGIRVAQGEYLLFLNSGDWLYEAEVLEKVKGYWRVEFGKILAGDIIITDYKKETVKYHPERMTYNYLSNGSIAHQSTFIYRDLFLKFGLYNENFKIMSDWAFFFKTIAVFNVSFRRIPQIISMYNRFGISSNIDNKEIWIAERREYIESFLPALLIHEMELFQKINRRFSSKEVARIVNITDGKCARDIFKVCLRVLSMLINVKRSVVQNFKMNG